MLSTFVIHPAFLSLRTVELESFTMNRQEVLYLILAITAVLELTISPLETHSLTFAEFAIFVALAASIGAVTVFILVHRNFSREIASVNRANAVFIAAAPIAVGLLDTLFGTGLNVHGISLPAILLYFAISELCALTLLIRSVIHAI